MIFHVAIEDILLDHFSRQGQSLGAEFSGAVDYLSYSGKKSTDCHASVSYDYGRATSNRIQEDASATHSLKDQGSLIRRQDAESGTELDAGGGAFQLGERIIRGPKCKLVLTLFGITFRSDQRKIILLEVVVGI